MGMQRAVISGLYVDHSATLRRHLQRKLGDERQAEDAVQDAFVRLLSAPGDDVRSPKAYLFTVATNVAIDHIRSERRMKLLFPAGIDAHDAENDVPCTRPSAEDELDAKMRLSRVTASLEALPAKCREAFVMHKFWDMSYVQVAGHLGVTVSMVEKHISRALAHLRTSPAMLEA